jgi:hypothetical protein
VLQTGPNTQSGGLKEGLINVEYQGSLKLTVANPPINEELKVIIKNKIKVKYLFLSMLRIYTKNYE